MKNHLLVLSPLFFLMIIAGCQDKPAETENAKNVVQSIDTNDQKLLGFVSDSASDRSDKEETDLERLSRIQNRLNKTGLADHAVVFAQSQNSNNFIVSIDFILFDRLSDSAVACMILESMFYQPVQYNDTRGPMNNRSLPGSDLDTLEIDFKVGQHIAKSGFSSQGFQQWLNEKKIFEHSGTQQQVTESKRIMQFMKGYQSVAKNTK